MVHPSGPPPAPHGHPVIEGTDPLTSNGASRNPTSSHQPQSVGAHAGSNPGIGYTNNLNYGPPSQTQGFNSLSLFLFSTSCTYCQMPIHPDSDSPVVLCHGCGPMCNIRYCSTDCLLVDVLSHSPHCMHTPASQRLMQHSILENHIYEQNPLAALDGLPDPPYKARQKAFSIYSYSGQFPKLYKAWAKKFTNLPVVPGFDENESFKKTGQYAVFRSEITGGPSRNNPNAEIIFT